MTNHKKQDDNKAGVNPVLSGVAGAVVGAGIVAAAAGVAALQDEKNRDKVKEVLINAKNQAVNYVKDMQNQAEDKKDEIEEKLAEGKEKVKKIVNSA